MSGFPPSMTRHGGGGDKSGFPPPLKSQVVGPHTRRVRVVADRVSPPSLHVGSTSGNPTGLVGGMERGKSPSPTNRVNLLDQARDPTRLLSACRGMSPPHTLLASSSMRRGRVTHGPASSHARRSMKIGMETDTHTPTHLKCRNTQRKRMESTRLPARQAPKQVESQVRDLQTKVEEDTQGDGQ